jgi:opacity protein-like surface antigen
MRKLLLSAIGACAIAMASAAQAVVPITITPNNPANPAGTVFITASGVDGTISATLGHVGIPSGDFEDLFQFHVPVLGTGSGSLTTSVTLANYLGALDTDLLQVYVNGVLANLTITDADGNPCAPGDRTTGTCGANETWSLNNVTLLPGALNTIDVIGLSRGNGSYGGNATFVPTAVPEPAAWALMLVGFAGIGFQLRRKRNEGLAQLA